MFGYRYTLRKITKGDKLFGRTHGSADGYATFCGIMIDENWYFLTNDFTGKITCKKCKQCLEKIENWKS